VSTNVLKFGGTSLASAAEMINAANIVKEDGAANAVVVSAPGKRTADDEKVTDVLYRICKFPSERDALIERLKRRFDDIMNDVGAELDFSDDYENIAKAAKCGDAPYVVSRGEYFSARIMAEILGYTFVDAAAVIAFDESGIFLKDKTYSIISSSCKNGGKYVIPGFYGADNDGRIFVFPRGGSDITGAVVAAALEADMYKNYTDVDGFMFADPKYMTRRRIISHMSYREAYYLSACGAGVIHGDAVLYASEKNIPIIIKNTFAPSAVGTIISGSTENVGVYGVAGRRNCFGGGISAVAVGCVENQEENIAECREMMRRDDITERLLACERDGFVFGIDDARFDAVMRLFAEKL